MPLIVTDRHAPEDLEVWARLERLDRLRVLQGRRRMDRMEAAAMEAIRDFFAAGPGYVGTSWGKDSVVVAHLAWRVDPEIPVVWCRLEPYDNPHCVQVRDAFLSVHSGAYHEVTVQGPPLVDGSLPTGARRPAFALAAERFGDRYVSGVRSEESGARKLREMHFGIATDRTCAPITRWTGEDVFAYLCRYELPIHPAYAMTRGGRLERKRLRVASLGGLRGIGVGRREWERHYYGEELARLGIGS